MAGKTVSGINFVSEGDTTKISLTVMATVTVDATELGDLYPMTNTSFRVGIDSQNDTGEPHALPQAYPGSSHGSALNSPKFLTQDVLFQIVFNQ
jgi:hypothetical protein